MGHGDKKLPRFGAVEGEQVAEADRLQADRRGGACASFASVRLQLAVKSLTASMGGSRFPITHSDLPGQPTPLDFAGIHIDSR